MFIAVDDLNCDPGLFGGDPSIAAPHLARLADRGVAFTNAHCAAPACNPSRVSVLSGLAPSTTGVYANPQDWRENQRLKRHTSLPQHFKDHGYTTLGGGKIYHAASLSEWGYTGLLEPRPWDEYFPSKSRQMPQEALPERIPTNGDKAFYGGRFDWAPLDIPVDEMADAKVVSWAERQLAREHAAPLFLAVGLYRPHIPWYTPAEYFDRFPLETVRLPEVRPGDLDDVPAAGRRFTRRHWHDWVVKNNKWRGAVRGYHAAVAFADDMIGRLIAALDEGPLAGNTVVVLWSDHGYHLGQKEHWEKFTLWEQATRVPLVIVAPDGSDGGAVCREPVSLLDLYPTLCELCGLPAVDELDGESLVPLISAPATPTGRAVVSTHLRGNHAVRSDRWRYIRYADGSEELYDHADDPREFNNLAAAPEHVAVMQRLAAWLPKENAKPDPKRGVNKRLTASDPAH